MWLNMTNIVQSSTIVVNVYEIINNDNDCSAAKNKLLKTVTMYADK